MEVKLVEAFLFLVDPAAAVVFGEEKLVGNDDKFVVVDVIVDSIERLEFGFTPIIRLFRCISGFCGLTRITLCRDSIDGTELVFALAWCCCCCCNVTCGF